MSFSFAPDISRDIVVGLQAIKSVGVGPHGLNTTELLPSPILTFIDSTFPFIYLPSNACQAFEKQFNLQFNDTVQRYIIEDDQHEALLSSNTSFTFTIANQLEGGPTVDIVLPYSSFDLEVTPPLVPENARYFPILPAQNETQYTLGRTFLQEA